MTSFKFSAAEEAPDIRRYPLEKVWRPKLLMMKTENLETIIYDCLCAAYKHWLETDYENKPDPRFLLFQLQRALKDEVQMAWKKFMAERRQA